VGPAGAEAGLYPPGVTSLPTVGVLAVQGDVREHVAALERSGARATTVRRARELDAVDALVLPGGESTAIDRLVRAFELQAPLRERITAGMPVLGSCAGLILLADRLTDRAAGQQTLGGIDMTVRRNGFGRQVDSFEYDLDLLGVDGGPVHAVFIRAPQVVAVGPAVQVLARVPVGGRAGADQGDTIVAVRQGPLVATSFHPELSGDDRVHRVFVRSVTGRPTGEPTGPATQPGPAAHDGR
jgi:5'-phosphate synthase pdxT subunit